MPSPTIDQITASTFDRTIAEGGKAANQWADSGFMRALKKLGFIHMESPGKLLEFSLDYRRNPGFDVLATKMTPVSTAETEILTAAQYQWCPTVVPVTLSITDEAKNSGSDTQKVALASQLVTNAVETHDDEIEKRVLGTNDDGLLGLQNLITADGEGSIAGLDSAVLPFWANRHGEYIEDASDIGAAFTDVWNQCAKSSGSTFAPTLMVSNAEAQALYEGTLQGNKQYRQSDVGDAGFEFIAFKTSKYVFSQHGTDDVYFLSPKAYGLYAIKGYYKKRGPKIDHVNALAWTMHIVSMIQAATKNRSRLGVCTQVPAVG